MGSNALLLLHYFLSPESELAKLVFNNKNNKKVIFVGNCKGPLHRKPNENAEGSASAPSCAQESARWINGKTKELSYFCVHFKVMHYFSGYFKKVIWLHNSRHLLCITPSIVYKTLQSTQHNAKHISLKNEKLLVLSLCFRLNLSYVIQGNVSRPPQKTNNIQLQRQEKTVRKGCSGKKLYIYI